MVIEKRLGGLDRFDRAVIVFAMIALVAIGVVVARGDQVGINVQKYSPQKNAPSQGIIQVTFDESIDLTSVESHFAIEPSALGKFVVNESVVTFQPTVPLRQGQTYTITVQPGIESTTGRTLKQPVQWTFTIRQPRLIYLGPANDVSQNLYLVDPTGTDVPQQLTNSPEEKGILSFDALADGSKIVYSEFQGQGASSLFTWDFSTGAPSLLYACPDSMCTNPVWRPDGGAVAFERAELNTGTGMPPGAPRIWILDMASKTAGRLFSDGQRLGTQPHWSPDGNRLAVYDVNSEGIVIHDFATNKDTVIKTPQGQVGEFSPDGNWIYFPKIVALPNSNYVGHIVLVDISKEPYIQHDLVADSDPNNDVEVAWRADSKSMIVARRPPDVPNTQGPYLYSIEITTGKALPLVVDPAYSQNNLAMSPGGSTLAFQRFALGKNGGTPEIWILDLQTNELRLMASNAFTPRWIP